MKTDNNQKRKEKWEVLYQSYSENTVDSLGRFLSDLTQIFKMCLALTEIFALMDVEVCWEPFSIFQLLSAFFVGMCEIGANEYELTADPASRINNVCHKSSFEFFFKLCFTFLKNENGSWKYNKIQTFYNGKIPK